MTTKAGHQSFVTPGASDGGVTRRLIRHCGTPSGATYGYLYFLASVVFSFCGVAIYAGGLCDW